MTKLITLTTDFGTSDTYVGIMKGVIYRIAPEVHIVDLTHQIEPQNIIQAMYLSKGAYSYFPRGTIHIIVVDPSVGSKRRALVVKTTNYHFLAPDNGVLSFLPNENEQIEAVREIQNPRYYLPSVSNTFHGRDIFSPAAAYLANGESFREFGHRVTNRVMIELPKVVSAADYIEGEIVYNDHFGNLISNISFKDIKGLTIVSISIGEEKFEKILHTYSDVASGEPLLLIGSTEHLELAINCGNAKEKFQFPIGTKIRVQFK